MISLKQINGFLLERSRYGTGSNDFVLRTKSGPVQIVCQGRPPVMRAADMISVVLSEDRVVAISNLSTGSWTIYQGRPFKPEGMGIYSIFGLVFGQLMVAFGAFGAGAELVQHASASDILEMITCFWFFGLVIIGVCEGRRFWAINHNIAVRNRIDKIVEQVCLDPNAWPEDAENEPWRDK
jgi:hypothetical protein